ncbi:specificity determinant for hsdM and hsdR [Acinetobacter baumannii]|nr:specificity determinant for hsdM and hsdR [Acinetobacter baumannii]
MSEWVSKKIGDIANLYQGLAINAKTKHLLVTESSLPLLRIKDLLEGTKEQFVDPKLAPLQCVVEPNELVMTRTGQVGYVFMGKSGVLHNNCFKITVTDPEVDTRFLYWHFNSNAQRDYLTTIAAGSVQPDLNHKVFKDYDVLLPPLPEQKAIASVLSSLDDKIDLLHRQNKTLEAMAETLFRQWFIEEAKEDWEELSVSDIAIHVKDNVNPSRDPLETFYHFSLPAFDSGQKPTSELGSEILSNKYRVSKNSILVSKLNPRVPRIWLVSNVEDNYVCSTEFQNLKPKVTAHLMFLYSLFNSRDVIDELTMSASGTSGSHQRVKPEDMLNITFRTPCLDYLEQYSSLIAPSMQKVASNKQQIQTLENLRDTLLPKLMSGEVRVQYQTEEVA